MEKALSLESAYTEIFATRAIIVSANRGIGSFLTFDFKLSCKDYALWVYLTEWKVFEDSQVLLDSDIEVSERYAEVLDNFLGKEILDFEIVNKQKVRFVFEDKLTLELKADTKFYDIDDDLFMFFDRAKSCVTSYSVSNGLVTEKYDASA